MPKLKEIKNCDYSDKVYTHITWVAL